jgi:hypothetical protein
VTKENLFSGLDDANYYLLGQAAQNIRIAAIDTFRTSHGYRCRLFDLNIEEMTANEDAIEQLSTGTYLDEIDVKGENICLCRDIGDVSDELFVQIVLRAQLPGYFRDCYLDEYPDKESAVGLLTRNFDRSDVVWQPIA